MNEWVTDRLPVEDDATIDGMLFVFLNSEVYLRHWTTVGNGEPWATPVEPPAYIPPKRRRFKDLECRTMEIMPGDPADLDALLDAIDNGKSDNYRDWCIAVREARKPEDEI